MALVAMASSWLASSSTAAPDQVTIAPVADRAVVLFDGATLTGWQVLPKGKPPASVRDGVLRIDSSSRWLLTEEKYFDFTLTFDARVAPGARAGLLLRVLPMNKMRAGYEVPLADESGEAGGLLMHFRDEVGPVLSNPTKAKVGEGWREVSVECIRRALKVRIEGTEILNVEGLVQNLGWLGFVVARGTLEVRRLELTKHRAPVTAAPPGVHTASQAEQAPGLRLPRLRREVKPSYTAYGLSTRQQGEVWLDCVVLPDGTVGEVYVVQALTPDLDAAAIAAARQWRFEPGTLDGTPVPVLVTISMGFALR